MGNLVELYQIITLQQALADTTIQKPLLIGIIEPDESNCDQLYFKDSIHRVPCVLLHCLPSYFNGDVCLVSWQLRGLEQGGYCLEIETVIASDMVSSYLRIYHLYSSDLDVLSANSRCWPTSSPRLSNGAELDLNGIVLQKSALLSSANLSLFVATVQFHLSDADQQLLGVQRSYLKANICFKSTKDTLREMIIEYHCLLVDESYNFRNMKPAKLKFNSSDLPVVGLLFTCGISSYSLDILPPKSGVGASAILSQITLPAAEKMLSQSQGAESKSVISYIGQITRVVDLDAGIYEIDEVYLLCTTFYPINTSMAFYPGAVVTMKNVHLVLHGESDKIFFLACVASTLLIQQFSTTKSLIPVVTNSAKRRSLDKFQGMNFVDILNYQALEATLGPTLLEFGLDKLTSLRNILAFFGYIEFKWAQYHGLLNHDFSCCLTESKYSVPDVESVLCLIKRGNEWYESRKTASDSIAWSSTRLKTPISSSKTTVVGYLDTDRFGALLLRGAQESSIPLLLTNAQLNYHKLLGSLCLVTNYELVVEELKNPPVLKSDRKSVYLMIETTMASIHPLTNATNIERTSAYSEFVFIPNAIGPTMLTFQKKKIVPYSIAQGIFFSADLSRVSTAKKDKTLLIRFAGNAIACSQQFELGKICIIQLCSKDMRSIGDNAYLFECPSSDQISVGEVTTAVIAHFGQLLETCIPKFIYHSVSGALDLAQQTIQPGAICLVNLQCTIVAKSLILRDKSQECKLQFELSDFLSEYAELQILNDHFITLGVQTYSEGKKMSIEAKQVSVILPPGLYIGANVVFENLALEMNSAGVVTGSIVASTKITPTNMFHDFDDIDLGEERMLQSNSKTLLEHITQKPFQTMSVRVAVNALLKLEIYHICQSCSSVLDCDKCFCGSMDAPEMCGSLQCEADDGSMVARLTISNMTEIFRLLKFQEQSIQHLSKLVGGCGKISWTCSNWKIPAESDPLSSSQAHAQEWIEQQLKNNPWQREVRIVGIFSKELSGSFESRSPSCLVNPALVQPRMFKDLEAVGYDIAGIKHLKIRVHSVGEIDPILEAYSVLKKFMA